MSVLAHLGDQDTRTTAIVMLELIDALENTFNASRHRSHLSPVDPGNGFDSGPVTSPYTFKRLRYLSYGRLDAGGSDGDLEKIVFTTCSAGSKCGKCGKCGKGRRYFVAIALGLQAFQLFQLLGAHRAVIDFQNINRWLGKRFIAIDAYDLLLTAVDLGDWVLRAMRRALASGKPNALVKGNTLMVSAPPVAAENTAVVERRRLVQGS